MHSKYLSHLIHRYYMKVLYRLGTVPVYPYINAYQRQYGSISMDTRVHFLQSVRLQGKSNKENTTPDTVSEIQTSDSDQNTD